MFSTRNTVAVDGTAGDAAATYKLTKEGTATTRTDSSVNVCGDTVRLKSLVVQKSSGQSTCIAYSFRLERMQRVKVAVHVNEKG